MTKISLFILTLCLSVSWFSSCTNAGDSNATPGDKDPAHADSVAYFNLRPKLEKEYGYSHAVKIGDDLKISGR
jgi:hypothetical protein